MAILPQDRADFESEVARMLASDWLGRSYGIARLFDYLIEAAREGRSLREIELAQDVFGRTAGLDADASVRVYVHRLRKKLAGFYAEGPGQGAGVRLTLPIGGYALAIERPAPEPSAAPTRLAFPSGRTALAVAAALLLAAVVAAIAWWSPGSGQADLRRSPLWQGLGEQRPILVVIGDFYIFGELDKQGEIRRMVREFAVDSPADLERFVAADLADGNRYVDLDTTYTPSGATVAMQRIVPAVEQLADGHPFRVITSSQLTPDLLKSNDIVYLGYPSGMRILEGAVFARARMQLGGTYDELVDSRSDGKTYVSTAGLAAPDEDNADYAYLRRLVGPGGNTITVVAGMRDIGVVQAADIAANPPTGARPVRADGEFEALYKVRGVGRTSLGYEPVVLGNAPPRQAR